MFRSELGVGVAIGTVEGAANYALGCGSHTLSGYLENAGVGAAVDAFNFGTPEELLFGDLGAGSHAAPVGGWLSALLSCQAK